MCYAYKIETQPDGKVFIDLGFSATPPEGYGIRLIPRSNLTKYWWVLNNSIGIGDPDYKNNYQARFTPLYTKSNYKVDTSFPYKEGDRVCQMEIYKRNDFEFEIVEELSGNNRGGGLGKINVLPYLLLKIKKLLII